MWNTNNTFVVRVPEQLGMTDEEKAEYVRKNRKKIQAMRQQTMVLVVDIYDWNRLGAGVFLGCVEIRGDELEDFAAGGKKKFQWFDLGKTTRYCTWG